MSCRWEFDEWRGGEEAGEGKRMTVSKQHGCSARGTLQCNASAMRSHISPAPQPVRSFETLRLSRTPPNSMSDQCEVLNPLPDPLSGEIDYLELEVETW
jgi:hypothetical protein